MKASGLVLLTILALSACGQTPAPRPLPPGPAAPPVIPPYLPAPAPGATRRDRAAEAIERALDAVRALRAINDAAGEDH